VDKKKEEAKEKEQYHVEEKATVEEKEEEAKENEQAEITGRVTRRVPSTLSSRLVTRLWVSRRKEEEAKEKRASRSH
jgi:hypothetical protein